MNKNKSIRLSKSSISSLEKEAVLNVLDEEYLGMGTFVHDFECSIAKFIGVSKEQVTCVNTGTAALHLAIEALDIGFGDEVIVPSITYIASAQAISAAGAKVVCCDVNECDALLCVKSAEKLITEKTKAIMYVHYASSTNNRADIYKLAEHYGLRVIEDAAHTFGSMDKNENLIGSNGDIICFSFDGIKNITSGEGGAIVSRDKLVNSRVKDARLLGVEKDTEQRYLGARSWHFNVTRQGYRYHMSNIMAAIGIAQLSRIDSFSQHRRQLVTRYREQLKESNVLDLFDNFNDRVVPHIFSVKIKNSLRDILVEYLKERGIATGIHYFPIHCISKYEDVRGCPVADSLKTRLLTLPLHYDLSLEDVDYIVDYINEFEEEYAS